MILNPCLSSVRERSPLIHCITNPISINQCANALLALGTRPIMAEHPCEVREITECASALMLNLGNITDARMESIKISAKVAAEKSIPALLDLVGISCSEMRRTFALDIVTKHRPAVIKGNFSEIRAFYDLSYTCAGVDADASLSVSGIAKAAAALAEKYGCTVLASGKTDIVTDGKRVLLIKNGCELLSRVTGTGCMLGAICAAFLSVCPPLDAAFFACAFLGICGELAATEKYPGSFFVRLMDNIGTLTEDDIEKHIKTEETTI